MAKRPGSAGDPLWYQNAIIYELHVRAFKDSNADGVGDFQGLIQKLDYLQDLGVTCLWLLPFFPSPLKDDGYDISDYLDVHPMYGTIADFQAFLEAAHDRGLQVMIELVVNHTSDQHPWFQETHAIIKKLRREMDAGYSNRMLLAEANQWPTDVRPYFGDGDECHMAFHFPLMPRIYMALRQEDRLPITDIVAQTPPIPDNCQWGLFLRNHDELTLEMVTNDERDYMYLAYSN